MLKVFSSTEITEAVLVRDALQHHGVEATTLNTFSGGSAVPEFRPPVEIWITRDWDFERARRLVVEAVATLDAKSEGPHWACASCAEDNPASFEVCWNCGQDKNRPPASRLV